VFSPTIKNTCPNRGTAADAEVAGRSSAAITTARSNFTRCPLVVYERSADIWL
jgi:hypothetical protein